MHAPPEQSTDETLKILDVKLSQLKLAYEQYFLGSRPREPQQLRTEVQKALLRFVNSPIQNTGLRFKFNGICSRYQAYKRQWNDTLRRMEDGSYVRHRFKADLHQRSRAGGAAEAGPTAPNPPSSDLFDAYVDARKTCGHDTSSLTPQKLERVLDKQRAALRERFGDADFRFKVVVQEGKVKLRAARVRA